MQRLGSLVLASVLLGVPRALDARAFGARRPVYVELSKGSPALLAFGDALSQVLAAQGAWSLVPTRAAAATIVDVLAVASGRDVRGRAVEAITLCVSEHGRARRIVLHAAAGQRQAAAQQLLASL